MFIFSIQLDAGGAHRSQKDYVQKINVNAFRSNKLNGNRFMCLYLKVCGNRHKMSIHSILPSIMDLKAVDYYTFNLPKHEFIHLSIKQINLTVLCGYTFSSILINYVER